MISFNKFHPNAVYLDKKTQDIVCYIEKIKLEYPLKDIIVWLDSDNDPFQRTLIYKRSCCS